MDASYFLYKDIKENKVNIKDIEKVISFYNCYFEKSQNYTNNFTKASYNKDYFSFVKSCNYYLKEIITKYNELTNNNFVLNTTDADYDTLYQKEREEYKRILEENRRKQKIREEKQEADAPVKEVNEVKEVVEVNKVNTEIIKQVIITVLKSLINTIEVKSLVKIIKIITKEKELLIIHMIIKRSRPPPENLRRLSNKGQAAEPPSVVAN